MSIIEFDKNYKDLICDDAPKAEPKKTPIDPWDGEKPHAENGFVEKYCLWRIGLKSNIKDEIY